MFSRFISFLHLSRSDTFYYKNIISNICLKIIYHYQSRTTQIKILKADTHHQVFEELQLVLKINSKHLMGPIYHLSTNMK